VPKLPLVARASAATVAIVPVDRDTFPAWLARQDRARARWIEANGFEPRGNRVLLLPDADGVRTALFGRGEGGLFSWSNAAQKLPAGRYRIDAELSARSATEAAIGWALERYDFDRYRNKTSPRAARELVWPAAADRGEALRTISAITRARDLINTPAADLGPAELASEARRVGREHDAKVRVISGAALAEGYPLVHAVGRGSSRRPVLIDLTWGKPKAPRLTLVGKGVCFDSGGLDLKNAQGMLRMKKDMAGAATVLSLAHLIMDAGLPVRLRVLIPAVENLPGEDAYRPLDVLRSRKGTTIEVTNTDAEGRLILADALAEADREEPDLLIDVATLTGSARLAVGTEITPFFSSDTKLADELFEHGQSAREPVWRLPLHKGYRRHLESRVADLKNAPSVQLAGAITAALFLREFVTRSPRWLHLDIFGWNDSAKAGRPAGGEPSGMRALWSLIRARYPRR
jgi:leucyl aminopeptidase